MTCIYIPLCFYFIFPAFRYLSRSFLIYIPLCFYFIYYAISSLVDCINLHSTMLLLYLRVIWPVILRLLHLHSTMLLLYRFLHGSGGVLPLNLHSTMLLLYLEVTINEGLLQYHLHSTMLLLYRMGSDASLCPAFIYIPLCFYFILRKEYQNAVLELFTFHYASTLSDAYSGTINRNSYLHSTMLLLYPVPLFPFYFLQYKYTFCLPHFLHISLLKNLPPPTLQNLNFP